MVFSLRISQVIFGLRVMLMNRVKLNITRVGLTKDKIQENDRVSWGIFY